MCGCTDATTPPSGGRSRSPRHTLLFLLPGTAARRGNPVSAKKRDLMPISGACECGSTTYAIGIDTLHVYACHCLNCQTRSGSAFAEHAMVPIAAFTCEGETVEYQRTADGIVFEEVFCRDCYTRLFNRNSMMPDLVFIRPGTLASSQILKPMAHIWTKRKQPWISIPQYVPAFEQSPTPEEFGAAIQAADQRS